MWVKWKWKRNLFWNKKKKNNNNKLTNTGCIVISLDALQDASVGVQAALAQLIEVVAQVKVVWIGLDERGLVQCVQNYIAVLFEFNAYG